MERLDFGTMEDCDYRTHVQGGPEIFRPHLADSTRTVSVSRLVGSRIEPGLGDELARCEAPRHAPEFRQDFHGARLPHALDGAQQVDACAHVGVFACVVDHATTKTFDADVERGDVVLDVLDQLTARRGITISAAGSRPQDLRDLREERAEGRVHSESLGPLSEGAQPTSSFALPRTYKDSDEDNSSKGSERGGGPSAPRRAGEVRRGPADVLPTTRARRPVAALLAVELWASPRLQSATPSRSTSTGPTLPTS